MNEHKNIERLFQEKFKDFEAIPHENVWDNIQVELNKKEKRRIIPFWWKLSGIAAALLMSNIQATLHSLINYTHNLKDIIIELKKRVWLNAKGEKFVSFFLGKINTKSKQLTYINAGHNPPILISENNEVRLAKGCTLLGIAENIPFIDVEILDMNKAYTLFCYTDGLTDTVNSADEYLSEETVVDIIKKNINSEPEFINDTVMYYADEFKGENLYVDDIALMTIKCAFARLIVNSPRTSSP